MRPAAHFQVDSRLATLLGESYRSSEYAIKELVDNCWDADAENVWVNLPDPLTADPIIIRDDGHGMTEREVLNEYLVVANDRRSRKGERTPFKNRLVKGRKGIGKFAGLMAADVMIIETKARENITRLRIRRTDLLEAKKDLERIDLPYETENCDPKERGTTITLSNLNQNLAFPNPEKLKQLLILEYGRTADFKIRVNGDLLDIEDIPGQSFTEEIDLADIGKIKLRFTIAEGTKKLKQSGVVVRVGGKIVGKPNYFGLEDDEEIPNKLLNKMYGEIEADGLADDVTADWGAIIENSKKYQELREWANSKLKSKVENVFAQEVNLAKARLQKEINKRLEQLPEYRREFAKTALERVMRRFYGESEEKIRVIVSIVLEAFERDEYWVVLQKIDEAKHRDVETFAEALGSFGLLDMALIAQQTIRRNRLLDEFDELIANPNTLERTMHVALEKNLWIFGSEYSMMSSNETLARTIEEYTKKKFTGERAKKRPDLFLAHDVLDRHLLVEFKRPSHIIIRGDENQAEEYRDDLTSFFGKMMIIVLGDKKDPKISDYYDKADIKLISYRALISNARTQLQWLLDEFTKNPR
ncbi:ATP-binding protein [candidate division KSB1 bacterium]|nr:ATP-binding protein [candidate division KSB1 bacterium]